MSIAENMKKLRMRFDLTQEDLADIAGVTNKAVSSWEKGNSEPRMGAIEKIANRFNIKKSNLIETGGMDNLEQSTNYDLVQSFLNDGYTTDEVKEIIDFAKYLKSKRNN